MLRISDFFSSHYNSNPLTTISNYTYNPFYNLEVYTAKTVRHH